MSSANFRAPQNALAGLTFLSWSTPGQPWVLMRMPFLPKGVPRAISERFWDDLGMPGHRKTFVLLRKSKDFEEFGFCALKHSRTTPEAPRGSPGAPKSTLLEPQGAPRATQTSPKSSQGPPWNPSKSLKSRFLSEIASKNSPRGLQERFWTDFGAILHRFSVDFFT